jgi:signal transduction histidine kinase
MRRIQLSTLLISINVALLLLTIGGVAFAAVRLLNQLADEQALARVSQAGESAQHAISRSADDTLTAAQVLAERPTLKHYLDIWDTASLAGYLAQYQRSSHLDGCAVLVQGHLATRGGLALPWETIWSAAHIGDVHFLHVATDDAPMLLGAWAHVPANANFTVMTVEVVNTAFARRVSDQVGLPVAILERRDALASVAGARAALRKGVLTSGQSAIGQVDAPPEYLAVQPLRTPSGQVVGVIETALSAAGTLASVHQLVQTLLVVALAMCVVSALVSLLVGRRLGAPLRSLTAAATRIGSGDLDTPVPLAYGAEIGVLAEALEQMREQLAHLTAQLRKQRSEANAIVHGIVEGVFTVDRQRRIRYLNPQAAAMLGIAPEAAIGRFCGDVLRPLGSAGVRPCVEHCPIVHARFRGGVRAIEHLELPNGQRRTVIITSSPIADEQQVQVMRDETEVEATRRLRDAVLANISHEFKTPLAAQLASIELLLDQLPILSVEQIGDLVLALQRGTLRLTQLIDNLLESVRIEAGKASIRHQVVMLDEVVEEAVALIRPLFHLREQGVEVDLPYPLPAVRGDALRLTQVFVNLLANATKFAPTGSTIRIGGRVALGGLQIWVDDEGPGLPSSGQALFDRFVRSSADEPEQGGVGLGLWIVKSIVQRHGGRVEALQADTQGARICVTLPTTGVTA